MEKDRIEFLKERLSLDESEIIKLDLNNRKTLINELINKKNKGKVIKTLSNFINVDYMSLISRYLKLTKTSISKLTKDELQDFRSMSKEFLLEIPEKSKKQYNESGICNEKYLFFLQTAEYLE